MTLVLGDVDDRIEGLRAGADDYLAKPFAFGELSARVGAIARRPQALDAETVLRSGDLEMNLLTRKVTRGGTEIDLLPREGGGTIARLGLPTSCRFALERAAAA